MYVCAGDCHHLCLTAVSRVWFRDTLIAAAAALVVDDDGYDDVDLVNQFFCVFISRYRGSASINVTVSNLSYESLELYGIKFAPKKTSYNILCAEFLYRYVNVYMCVCVFYAPSSYIDM